MTDAEISCTAAEWMQLGIHAVENDLLRRVTLTDKRPLGPAPFTWTWETSGGVAPDSGAHVLPSEWWIQLRYIGHRNIVGSMGTMMVRHLPPQYPSEQAALDDLSQACIAWARDRKERGGVA